MATFKDLLTKDGHALITKMLAGSCKIRFTRVVFGDGYLPTGTDPRNVTEVISPKYESEAAAGKSGQVVTVSGVFTNQNFTEATYLREKGVYATDGEHEVLMIYANNGEAAEYIEPSDTSLIEKVMRSVLQFGQDDIVSIEVASGIYVTVENYQQDMIILEKTITERFEKVTELLEYECKISPRYVTDIDVISGTNCIVVRWKDPGETFIDGVRVALWDGTKLVMNEDHYPESVDDGTLVIDNTEKNKYSNEGFVVTGLTNLKNYYFRFFPYCVCGGANDYSEENKFKGIAGLLPMDNVTNISAVQSNDKIVLKWTDPVSPKVVGDASIYWKKTVVVYKKGSCPTSMEDGTVIEETTLNQYQTNGLEIYGIQNGTYYFRFFTVSTDDIVNSSEEQVASCDVAFATVTVKAPSSDLYGKAVKLTVGSNTLTSTFSSSGTAVFSVPWTGTASIVCSISSGLADASLNIAAMTSYTVTIGYIKYVTWANGSNAEIKAMIDAHYAGKLDIHDYWAVGDQRLITYDSKAVTAILIDVNHDMLENPINDKDMAAFTVFFVDTSNVVLSYKTESLKYTNKGATSTRFFATGYGGVDGDDIVSYGQYLSGLTMEKNICFYINNIHIDSPFFEKTGFYSQYYNQNNLASKFGGLFEIMKKTKKYSSNLGVYTFALTWKEFNLNDSYNRTGYTSSKDSAYEYFKINSNIPSNVITADGFIESQQRSYDKEFYCTGYNHATQYNGDEVKAVTEYKYTKVDEWRVEETVTEKRHCMSYPFTSSFEFNVNATNGTVSGSSDGRHKLAYAFCI